MWHVRTTYSAVLHKDDMFQAGVSVGRDDDQIGFQFYCVALIISLAGRPQAHQQACDHNRLSGGTVLTDQITIKLLFGMVG